MEVSGKIIAILSIQGGTSKSGNEWKKQDYILETHDQYPKKICFNLWGEKIDQYAIQSGEEVTVSFDIESREFNGKWYTNINGWKVDRADAAQAMPAAGYTPDNFATGAVPTAPDFGPVNPIDDLPF